MMTNIDPSNPSSRSAHVLVALDGSRLAETPLPLAETLARALNAEIVLLHVLEEAPPARIHGEPHLTTSSEAESYLALIGERLLKAGLPVATHVHTEPERDVVASIAAHAEETHADLIVLAAHGAGRIRQMIVGRIPQQVAAKVGRPVLIVPAPIEGDLSVLNRILLPVDPMGEVEASLPLARHLAAACGAELVLVTIIPTHDTLPGAAGVTSMFLPHTVASMLQLAEENARATLEELAGIINDEGIATTIDVRRGDAAHELVQAVAAHRIDLVVMATHVRIGLQGIWTGSVTPRVLAGASCPVLLVPIRESAAFHRG